MGLVERLQVSMLRVPVSVAVNKDDSGDSKLPVATGEESGDGKHVVPKGNESNKSGKSAKSDDNHLQSYQGK